MIPLCILPSYYYVMYLKDTSLYSTQLLLLMYLKDTSLYSTQLLLRDVS